MICTLSSRLLGFVRTALISAFFGASGSADVLNAVFAIPNNLRKLMAEGALSSAFIPELSRAIVEEKEGKVAVGLSRKIIGFQLVVLIPLTLLSIVFAPVVIRIFTSFELQWKVDLSEQLFVWLINYIILISISAVLMAVLNSHSRFLIPALTPILFSVSVISSLILFHQKYGIFAMAIGVLVGGIAQLLFQLPSFFKLGYKILPSFDFKDERFLRVLKQWGPVLATSSIFTINHQIAILIATSISDGSVSALTNAIVFWQLPSGIFSASITTVLFPKMSRLAGAGDYKAMKDTVEYGIKALAVLLIPSAFLMGFLGKEIIAVAFQRGKFTSINTLDAARVLLGYCAGMFMVGVYNFTQRFYYSLRDYKTPFIAALVTVILDIALSLFLKETILTTAGLSWANTISFSVGMFILLSGISGKSGHSLNSKLIFITLLKTLVSLLPAGIFIYGSRFIIGNSWWENGSTWLNFLYLLIQGVVSLGLILVMYNLLNVEFISIIKRKGPK
ncbi:putative peptidoglycan lipid II flippase [Spirochaeta isovalerica]|uniref:Probable lipid II flippase MurJ n=2 Tax=Spirochaeta isovalerica TaxID=150 RepID=A0A841R6J7_9SPIO|nr:putative peptidoglycan lipid II flippase [Spirochaeta isovalerica]